MSVIDRSALAGSKDKTRTHYRTFHNIFLYVTERCQLRCRHCYMGERLSRGQSMEYGFALDVMSYCRRLGAKYLTFVGGEPTLHADLPRLVAKANELGFEKVYIDTNALRADELMVIPADYLAYVRVSLDGGSPASHDRVRGKGKFAQTISSIEALVRSGYSVAVTCTVFPFSIHEAPELLVLADSLGISLVNFHVFSEEGCGAGKSEWSLPPEKWMEFCAFLERTKDQYRASIWYPPSWGREDEIREYATRGFQGCLGCTLDRLSIFPDGTCYVCSLLFDTSLNYGQLSEHGLVLNRGENEFELFTRAMFEAPEQHLTGCPAEAYLEKQGKRRNPAGIFSVCRCWKAQI